MNYNKVLAYYKKKIELINDDEKEVVLTKENYLGILKSFYTRSYFSEQIKLLKAKSAADFAADPIEFSSVITSLESYLESRTQYNFSGPEYLEKRGFYPEFV